MKEIRIISREKVIIMCIKFNFFTKGNIEEYENMLNYVNTIDNLTLNEAIKIAEIIQKYSTTDYEIRDIAILIINTCTYTTIDD